MKPQAPGSAEAGSGVGSLVRFTEILRSGRLESWHLGAAVVSDADGTVLAAAGDPGLKTYLRSAAKPLQLVEMLDSGLERSVALEEAELAVCAASHGGEPGHVACVRSLMARAGLHEDLLRCGAHPPLDHEAAEALVRQGEAPHAVHNNCSGKHAAMLLTARSNGWDEASYLLPEHPLQQRIAARVGAMVGAAPEIGVDGCGVPTFYVSLRGAATMIARLMALAAEGGNASRVVTSMTSLPWYTSASHRGAFRLMTSLPGVLAKEGAEGFFVIGLCEERSPWRRPVGLAFKVSDGAGEEARGRDVAVAAALLGLDVARVDEREALRELTTRTMLNAAGRPIGEIRGVLSF